MNTLSQLPGKQIGCSALLFNNEGYLLIVKPIYRSGWLLPGGFVEEGESPLQGCIREVKEELYIDVFPKKLLCIDYTPKKFGQDEKIQFIFYGGTLSYMQIQHIILQKIELNEHRFLPPEDAMLLLSPRGSKRLFSCLHTLQKDRTVYLEDGNQLCDLL